MPETSHRLLSESLGNPPKKKGERRAPGPGAQALCGCGSKFKSQGKPQVVVVSIYLRAILGTLV